MLRKRRAVLALALGLGLLLAGAFYKFWGAASPQPAKEVATAPPHEPYKLTRSQLTSLVIAEVQTAAFHAQVTTDGRIAVDEDHTTPVFSPYAGRIIKLLVKPGDTVVKGQSLFVVEATDMVQGLNDYVSALTGLNKAKAQVRLMTAAFARASDLYKEKAVSLKDYQQAEANVVGAKNDQQAAETGLEAARNRLRILGKSEAEIQTLDKTGKISAETTIEAPLAGTVVLRKVGPGQYVNAGATDPVFVIGDLTAVWLIANVRETDAPRIKVGQDVRFSVLADQDRSFSGKVDYVAPSVDPTTRRLQVRAVVANSDGMLRPEMFANVDIVTSTDETAPAVPRNAVIYEGSDAHVWLLGSDDKIELRRVRTGLIAGGLVQVVEGLAAGDRIVTKGALFVDRLAISGEQ